MGECDRDGAVGGKVQGRISLAPVSDRERSVRVGVAVWKCKRNELDDRDVDGGESARSIYFVGAHPGMRLLH